MSTSRPVSAPRPRAAWLVSAALLALLASSFAVCAQDEQVSVTRISTSLPGPRYAYVATPDDIHAEGTGAEATANLQSSQFRKRLERALDKALQSKGYVPASGPAEADFFIAYQLGVHQVEQVLVKEIPSPHSAPVPQAAIECTAGGCSQLVTASAGGVPTLKTSVKQSMEGDLLVEAVEPGTIRVLWRASGKGTVKRGDGRQSRLDAVAAQVLGDFPALPR